MDIVYFKKYMHSLSNRIAFFTLIPLFGVGSYFIFRDAETDLLKFIGVGVMILLYLIFALLFIYKLKVLNKIIFYKEKFVIKELLKQKEYKYEDYLAVIGDYTSIIEEKKAFIFIPKRLNIIVKKVDTSKTGNVIALNKNEVFYCLYDKVLHMFLDDIFSQKNKTE